MPDNKNQNGKTPGPSIAAGTKKPNPIDVHVGSRVKLRRMLVGLSQERLGEAMGLTFQQIQKYERGTNRIGASRLWQLAKILSVPVGFFYDDMVGADAATPSQAAAGGFAEDSGEGFIMDFLNTREGLELNRAFMAVTDPKQRRTIIELVRSMAAASNAQKETAD